MNKTELIKQMATISGLTQARARHAAKCRTTGQALCAWKP